jgi:hypothetical protein
MRLLGWLQRYCSLRVCRRGRQPAGPGSPRALDHPGLAALLTRSLWSLVAVLASSGMGRARSPFHSARNPVPRPSVRTVLARCVVPRFPRVASTPCWHGASLRRPADLRVGMEGAAGSTRPRRRKDRIRMPGTTGERQRTRRSPEREDRSEPRPFSRAERARSRQSLSLTEVEPAGASYRSFDASNLSYTEGAIESAGASSPFPLSAAVPSQEVPTY